MQTAGYFLLITRHNPGDVLNLLLDGNDIGLTCRVESRHDQYYKYCKDNYGGRTMSRNRERQQELQPGRVGLRPYPVGRRWVIRLRR